MYGKIFESMYDGTLASKGPWQALITFQQLIVLCDKFGVVDMTADAISRRTTVPLEIIELGLKELEKPDPGSRIDDENGARIVRLADHRDWGWKIVNHGHYRKIRNEEERKEYMRKYMAARRADKKEVSEPVSNVNDVSPSKPIQEAVSSMQNAKIKCTVGQDSETARLRTRVAKDILTFLNEKTERNFRPVDANLKLIIARLKQGYTPAQCRAVIAIKRREWHADPDMAKFLRPATLFNDTKFNQYVSEVPDQEATHATTMP